MGRSSKLCKKRTFHGNRYTKKTEVLKSESNLSASSSKIDKTLHNLNVSVCDEDLCASGFRIIDLELLCSAINMS